MIDYTYFSSYFLAAYPDHTQLSVLFSYIQPPPKPEPVQQPPKPEPVKQHPAQSPEQPPEQLPKEPPHEQPTVAPTSTTTESTGQKEADAGSNGSGEEEAEVVVEAKVEAAPAQPAVWKRGFDIALNTLEQQIKDLEVIPPTVGYI